MRVTPPQRTATEVLAGATTVVRKIGGENAALLADNARNTERYRTHSNVHQILTVSAPRSSDTQYSPLAHPLVVEILNKEETGVNTTSHLLAVAKLLQRNIADITPTVRQQAEQIIESLRGFLRALIVDDSKKWRWHLHAENQEREFGDRLRSLIDAFANKLISAIREVQPDELCYRGSDWLYVDKCVWMPFTGMGEVLAERLTGEMFNHANLSYRLFNTDWATRNIGPIGYTRAREKEPPIQGLDQKILHTNIGRHVQRELHSPLQFQQVDKVLRDSTRYLELVDDIYTAPQPPPIEDELRGCSEYGGSTVISGGHLPYIAGFRGYSDITMAMYAASVWPQSGVVCALEKQCPIMSANPKAIPHAEVVQHMTYDLTADFAGTARGANGQAIQAGAISLLQNNNIPTVVLNPNMEFRNELMTLIDNSEPRTTGIEIVAERDMQFGLRISSPNMIGRTATVGEVTTLVENSCIDLFSTGEKSMFISFNETLPSDDDVYAVYKWARDVLGVDEIDKIENRTVLFCLGNNMAETGSLLRAAAALHAVGVNVEVIDQADQNAMIFMVDPQHREQALRSLHEYCIERRHEDIQITIPAQKSV